MANLPESSTFDAGVYQLETTDPVIGGPSGVSNTPLKNLANRTKYLKDHVDALESSRAPLASPSFTGTPTAPTAPAGTNTTQLATTAFVKSATDAIDLSNYAPKASPALTGTPTAPTAAQGTNTTQLATTAFVNAEIAADAAPLSHVGAGGGAHALATTSANGFMSNTDKAALDNLKNGFGAGLSSSGYQRLPSGLIMQWGQVAVYTDGTNGGTSSVTFPIAFTSVAHVVACKNGGGVAGSDDVYANRGTSLTGFVAGIDSSTGSEGAGTRQVAWIAIGY